MNQTERYPIEVEIEEFFDRNPQKSFSLTDLKTIFSKKRIEWGISQNAKPETFIEYLTQEQHLKAVTLTCKEYPNLERYIWREPSSFLLVQPLKRRSYFSHGCAAFLHDFTKRGETEIYLNYEQSPKNNRGSLLQENIHRAFANKPRRSNLVYKYGDTEITVINGKHTDRYGVDIFTMSTGEEVDVTNKDRTLVDIAVRPAYCGGVKHVLEIFAAAREQVSATKIFDTLEILDYLYPYHQTIGFYMERAGYSDEALRIMEQRPIEFDFYLDNAMGVDKKFDKRWRIYYPSALE